jgi:hypothetical protein
LCVVRSFFRLLVRYCLKLSSLLYYQDIKYYDVVVHSRNILSVRLSRGQRSDDEDYDS